MKKIILFTLFFVALKSFAQVPYDSTRVRQAQYAYGFDYGNLSVKSLVMPKDTPRMAQKDTGAIAVVNGVVYVWDKNNTTGLLSWVQASGGTDTNFANTNLTFTGNRTHELGGKSFLLKDGSNDTYIDLTPKQNYNSAHFIGAAEYDTSFTNFASVESRSYPNYSSAGFFSGHGSFSAYNNSGTGTASWPGFWSDSSGSFSFIQLGNKPRVVYKHVVNLADSMALIFPRSATTSTGLFALAHDTVTGQIVRIAMTGGTVSDDSTAILKNHVSVQIPFLNQTSFVDTSFIIGTDTSRYIKWNTSEFINIPYLDTAAMRADGLLNGAGSSDTANLIFDSIPAGTSLPTALFQSGDTLRTRGFGDSAFSKFVINGAGVLVNYNDTAAMRTWILTFASGGGGGGADANAWHIDGDTWAAYKTIGNNSNFGMGFETNGTLRGRIDSIGTFLWAGAAAQVSATAGTYYKANFADTSNFTAIRVGGPNPLTSVTGAASNALFSITSSSSASAQGMITVWSGASSSNPVFMVTAQGLVSAPVMASAWTASLYRFASATGQTSVSNTGGTLGYLYTVNSGSITSSTSTTDGGLMVVLGTYNTSSPNTNTGKWAAFNVMPTIDQADAGSAATASIKIQASLNTAFDYSALWILDGGKINTNGSIFLNTAGGKLNIATGSNASAGTATLSSGSVTVNTTAVTANSLIFILHRGTSGTAGILSTGTITAGTSFVINSTSASDNSTVQYLIIN